jgi:hypothetical protein
MDDELTILDYVKALLTPWRGAPPPIPHLEEVQDLEAADQIEPELTPAIKESDPLEEQVRVQPADDVSTRDTTIPWLAIVALGLALAAQISLEPGPERTWGFGLGMYAFVAALIVWANSRGEWRLARYPTVRKKIDQLKVRWVYLTAGAVFSMLAFLTLGGNRLTLINILLWASAIVLISIGFWQPSGKSLKSIWVRLSVKYRDQEWSLKISTWSIILILSTAVVIFFRFYRFSSIPPEMVSDHAEKLLDVWDVINGELSIFFPRNTGREGFQMYLTALVIKVFGTGFSFNSLKIGTILAGLITLPFIYLLGIEISNKRAALFATIFAGIAYWPNVISRTGLRFSIYPLFVAPTLYFLIRGIRHSNRNDFILAGLFLGLGLHGYTPFRIVPLVILAAVGLYLIHSQSKGFRKQVVIYLLILILVSLIVFLPLLRYWLENPEMFSYRTFTRLGSIESPLPGPAGTIFIKNLWNAMIMFFWSNGEIWPVSVPHRPALDVVSAALYFIGIILLIIRYLRRRHWLDLFMFLSVPLLMLPSILSLAFPSENPTLNRTAGALVPVFLIIGLSFEGFISSIESRISRPVNKALVWVIGIIFLFWAGYQNYDLVFNQYQQNYTQSSWNTSEIGGAIRDFSDTIGSQENAFVVAYPHWVDTRLVGINAGVPTRDFAIWPDDLSKTLNSTGPKIFIVKIDDMDSLVKLQNLYPNGVVQRYSSADGNKDFFQYFVLAD